MSRRIASLLPSSELLARKLGERLRLARRRRRLSAKQVAERAGMTPMTLRSLERGSTGVTLGAYLAVMQVLGLEKDFDLLAQADTTGRALQDARISRRDRSRAESSLPTPPSPVSGGLQVKHHNRLSGNTSRAQLPRLFEALPAEQMRQALEAVPTAQIRRALSSLPAAQLQEMVAASAQAMANVFRPVRDAQHAIEQSAALMENATTGQLRQAMSALSVQLTSKPLVSNLAVEQLRESVEASSRAMEKAFQPIRDAQNAIEKSAALMEGVEQLHHSLDVSRATQTHKALVEQMPDIVEANAKTMASVLQPIRDAQDAIEKSVALIEKAPLKDLRRALDALPLAEIQKAFHLSSNQLHEMLEASNRAMEDVLKPIHDAQNAIAASAALVENAPTEQLRRTFESLPLEEMRRALEALPTDQIQNALSNLPTEQFRELVEANTKAFQDLIRPVREAQSWLEKSGFIGSKTLADLIETEVASPKTKER